MHLSWYSKRDTEVTWRTPIPTSTAIKIWEAKGLLYPGEKYPHAKIGANSFQIMSNQSVSATRFSELKSKIEQHQAKVAIIGLGYVGLPLALLYSEQNFPVTGFDIDQRKVSALNSGGTYIFRITEIGRAHV